MSQLPEHDLLDQVFPLDTARDDAGALVIGGASCQELAGEFGTPLYIYDEATLRAACRGYTRALAGSYPNALVLYAGKAYVDPTLLQVAASEGLGMDAVSSGEVRVAQAAGISLERVVLHGNNKLPREIDLALELGVGRIVVDALEEIAIIDELARRRGLTAQVLLRLTPGVEAHTHEYIRTGAVDSKFGLGLDSGAAEEAVARAMRAPNLDVMGLHAHIGSQIFDTEPYADTINITLDFAERMRAAHGLDLRDLSPGGGGGVRYTLDDDPPDPADIVAAIRSTVLARGLAHPPRLLIEPGRSIVARAGVALYAVGTVKHIPGVRTYVSVDGGMADNPRPALYQSKYAALLANRPGDGPPEAVTLAGRYCESGDVLLRDTVLPPLRRGDLIAVPASGAYHMSMASTYNMVGRPAVVMVADGQARLSRRRESDDDLLAVFP
ncbi:MAG: diaminopimelate decarboxylase [Chloroflexi bacterium]|nr:diaminopimelate decarboxylase [Chloroflexota bacterium]